VMAMQALLNDGDEVLVPAPDYPLWTAAVSLSGGTPVHYLCDENNGWLPDLDDIRAKITPRTRAIVVINPNNPTGALYPDDLLQDIVKLAREHQLMICADEIYDKIVYDGLEHTSIGALSEDVLTVTFNGLSKSYRSCGFRAGWMVVSGLGGEMRRRASDYIEGLNILASMRLCANVPGQYAIQTALGGHQSINDLIQPGGRLYRQRELAYDLLTSIPGVTCVKPKAALYLFPKLDPKLYPIENDQQFILDFAAARTRPAGAGFRFQLAHAGSFPRGIPAQYGRFAGRDRTYRAFPRHLPQTARGVSRRHGARPFLGAGPLGIRSWPGCRGIPFF